VWPGAGASWSRPVLERPGRWRRRAMRVSSARVLGLDPPVRLRWATAAPCLPSAVRVFLGMWAMVFVRLAAPIAFLTLRLAACRCFVVAMGISLPDRRRQLAAGEKL